MLDEREVESPRQLVLVGLDAPDEVRVLAAQVVDQSTEGDLELGSGCCRSTPSRSPGVAWNRKLKIIGLGSGFAEARFYGTGSIHQNYGHRNIPRIFYSLYFKKVQKPGAVSSYIPNQTKPNPINALAAGVSAN